MSKPRTERVLETAHQSFSSKVFDGEIKMYPFIRRQVWNHV